MKINKTYLFITISSIALVIVLIIQFNWILETARIKEQIFNEKANMILSRTAETLRSDKEACMTVELGCVKDNASELALKLGKNEMRNIDSILGAYMKLYSFHIDYSFELVKPGFTISKNENGLPPIPFRLDQPNKASCYMAPLNETVSKNGLELKLIIPDKEQFIRGEMGKPFMTSVILIIVVLIMFWRTVLSLLKEKKISEHTTDFLNNMTHEFKTPLTNISLAGKMLIKDSNITQEDKIKHYSGIILEENEKLKVQVEQVLSMTALERGEIPLQKTELNVHELINSCTKSNSIQIENKHGSLQLDLKAEKFSVNGDKTHLTNALCNLVENAIKYCKEKPEIFIETSNLEQNLIIVVSDNGIGIEEKYHQRVFDKFFRVPTGDVHNVKGFGLGLAYVKKIIELHRGTIELQSEKEVGTTFIIRIPYE